jgi:hypothetical protein
VYLSAFDSRLIQTCLIRGRSPSAGKSSAKLAVAQRFAPEKTCLQQVADASQGLDLGERLAEEVPGACFEGTPQPLRLGSQHQHGEAAVGLDVFQALHH